MVQKQSNHKAVFSREDRKNTSSIKMQASPPLTFLEINVDRASSIKRSALAIERRASPEASRSSLNVVANPRRVSKLGASARYFEPAGSFPRVFTANRACAASSRVRQEWNRVCNLKRTFRI